jgi:hypothetical protein
VAHSLPRFRTIMRPLLRTPEQGADTICWLAASHVDSGRFWLDRTARSTMRVPWLRYGPDEVRRTWETVRTDALADALVP